MDMALPTSRQPDPEARIGRLRRRLDELRGKARDSPPADVLPETLAELSHALDELSNEGARWARRHKESLDALVGGVAHDFNNILGIIQGHVGLALQRLDAGSPARSNLESSLVAVQRAADLVKSMLTYSGRGSFAPRTLDLARLLEEWRPLVEATLPGLRLEWTIDASLPPVRGDADQLRHALMHLLRNAAEAMGDSPGVVRVASRLLTLADEAEAFHWARGPEAPAPGRYVTCEVSDEGPGMDEETLRRALEPFFSTRFLGRGMGLATVLGTVRAHRGGLSLEGLPGRGVTVRLALPVAESRVAAPALESARRAILVVDDEPMMRDLAADVLEEGGFEVLRAGTGAEAVAVLEARGSEVGLVLLDLGMPQMDGAETLRRLRRLDPAVPVVLCSGPVEPAAPGGFERNGVAGFLRKPCEPEALLGLARRFVHARDPRDPGV